MAHISDRRRKKLEIAKNDVEREAEITERKSDGVVLITLEELKFVLAALLCTSFCILILVFVALPSSLFSASKPPTEFLTLIPVLLLLAFACTRGANKKATLLKVLKARREKGTF